MTDELDAAKARIAELEAGMRASEDYARGQYDRACRADSIADNARADANARIAELEAMNERLTEELHQVYTRLQRAHAELDLLEAAK